MNSKPKILVAGGAGYIGSHMCKCLSAAGYEPIVLDSLIHGHWQAVQWGPLVQGSIENQDLLAKLFSDHEIAAVMHFAAYIFVGESVADPGKYYQNNVSATLNLLHAMLKADVRRFIFSSTCAVYGEPIETPMTEDHPFAPVSPYGRTKLMVEEILQDFKDAYGLDYTSLRYFNAAGADPDGSIGEDHDPETHLIPLVLKAALGRRESIRVFGDDYPTRDGSCIRDYIHVNDLAQAHLLALDKMLGGDPGGIFNLGNGEGHSVFEVIETARRITGRPIPMEVVDRRPGDVTTLIGSSRKAMDELGWQPQYDDIEQIVAHAWNWHKSHPDGFPKE